MIGLTTLTLWSLGQAIIVRRRRALSRPSRLRDPRLERPDLTELRRDGRVERLGGGDRGLHRGQAQDPLGGRGEADLGRVADRAGARRRGVDDEPDLARRDEVEDRDLAIGLRRPPRRAWRPVARRSRRPPARDASRAWPRADSPPPPARRPAAAATPCRGPRSTAGRARPRRRVAAGRARRRAAPWPARPAGPWRSR